MKIYILGPVGSGKSTLAKKISYALNIKYHELDSIVWKKTITGDVKRASSDRDKLFILDSKEIKKFENSTYITDFFKDCVVLLTKIC